jgi:hypothetical protein
MITSEQLVCWQNTETSPAFTPLRASSRATASVIS